MMKGVLFVILITFVVMPCAAQAVVSDSQGMMYLNKNESEPSDLGIKRGYYVGPHVLGDSITQLLNKFEEEYVYYKKTEGAYATEEKKNIKFSIYKAVHRVDDYYVKGIKKGKIDASRIGEAKKNLKMILSKGIRLKSYFTVQVEEDLRKVKAPEEIILYFEKIKFKD